MVGWAADSGVGRELVDAVRNLPVSSAFILHNASKPTRKDLLVGTPTYFSNPTNLERQMELFLECHRPDTILTWEVPGSWKFPEIWARKGVRWIHMVHWDWFSTTAEHIEVWRKATRLLAPNRMCQRELKGTCGLESTLLPVPVDTQRLTFRERKKADLFVSVYGYGGPHNRRSIPEIEAAWRAMGSSAPKLLIRAQKSVDEFKGPIPSSISVQRGNMPEPSDLYRSGDIALQPSRYEGVGVSLIEAQASGLVVIAVDAPPMNEIVYGPLIPVERAVKVSIMGKPLLTHIPSVQGMVDIVSKLKGKDISEISNEARRQVTQTFSWPSLRDRWIETLSRK